MVTQSEGKRHPQCDNVEKSGRKRKEKYLLIKKVAQLE
jgi:hypothetical protein